MGDPPHQKNKKGLDFLKTMMYNKIIKGKELMTNAGSAILTP